MTSSTQSMAVVAQSCRIMIYLHGDLFDKAADFYRTILALPVYDKWQDSVTRGFMFDFGAFIIEIIDPRKPVSHANYGPISARVDNVIVLWHRLSQNYSKLTELRPRPWGDTDFAIYDPSGFEIIFFTPTNQLL